MIKCFILDDEANCITALKQLLSVQHPDIEIIGDSTSPDKTLQRLSGQEIRPDILFLDIRMPGKDGFAFLENLPKIDFSIIFTTAYDQYAIKAIRFLALDYLLKPVDRNDLKAAIDRYRARQLSNDTGRLHQLKKNISSGNAFEKLAIPTLSEISFINTVDIFYMESDNNYTIIHTHARNPIVSSKNIGYYEELLDQLLFFRIHNSYLINLKKIRRYIRGKDGCVELENGVSLEVSRRRKDQFLKFLELI